MISRAVFQPQQKLGIEDLHPPLTDIFLIEFPDRKNLKQLEKRYYEIRNTFN